MSRTILRRFAPTLLLAVALTACAAEPDTTATPAPTESTAAPTAAPTDTTATPTEASAAFPVTVTHDGGELTLDAQPTAIVSLSPTATEMLFAVGAGDLVIAADAFSNFPEEAPDDPDLSGFDPNVEAILALEPDLIVAQSDANDLVASAEAVGVPVILNDSAVTLDDTYAQIALLGQATGFSDQADQVNLDIQTAMTDLAAEVAGLGEGRTFYHELSTDLYSVTSSTFIGQVYDLFGLENIADAADPDGESFGYPQLSAEYLADADPDLVFLACTKFCAEDATTFAARDGFGDLTAVTEGNVIELDDDVASRWGPRIVEFGEAIATALRNLG